VLASLLVGLGGLVGSVARYWLGSAVQALAGGPFPVGILVVNVFGSFLVGLIMALGTRGLLSNEAMLFLTVGVCGGFTTMSAFSYDTVRLLQNGRPGLASLNVAVTLLAAFLAVWLGQTAASPR
jgi:CrcB protein